MRTMLLRYNSRHRFLSAARDSKLKRSLVRKFYTPFTRSSKHRAIIEQTSRKYI